MSNPIFDKSSEDPFEEFEFKPLTEGLGFHRQGKGKSDSTFELKPETSGAIGNAKPDLRFEARRDEKNIVDDLLDLNSLNTGSLDQPLLKTPLLKRDSSAEPAIAPATSSDSKKVSDVLQSLQKRNWNFEDTQKQREALKSPAQYLYRTSGYDVSAIVLDAMLVTAAFLGSLIVLLMITKVDLIAAVTSASSEILVLSLASVFAVICWAYTALNRLFLGATPGEWVFDQRLGRDEEQGRALFSLKAVLRSTLIVMSGIVPLPLISMLLGYDVLGRMMGLELHQKTLSYN